MRRDLNSPMTTDGAVWSRISVAPMMDRTDRHCRFMLRAIAPSARLYTEMVTARAVVHGDSEHLLGYDPSEHPVALQLGGSEPELLAAAAAVARPYGYDEINLNVGCPSERVSSGAFGACLMYDPGLVAECVAALQSSAGVPVTVKTRIGVDDRDDFGFLSQFVDTVARAGCRVFIVHARKAILKGLSPHENRTIPPLRPEVVYRLKAEHPELTIVINGGVDTVGSLEAHLGCVDGVMIGRKAYREPMWLAELDSTQGGAASGPDMDVASLRAAVIARMADYAAAHVAGGGRLHHVTRHMLGLFHGEPGARAWRRMLGEAAAGGSSDPGILRDALAAAGADCRPETRFEVAFGPHSNRHDQRRLSS